MNNTELKEYLEEKIKYYKNKDLHIHNNDNVSQIRMKDMDYAKLLAYEEIFNVLQECKQVDKCKGCSNYNIGDGIEDINKCNNCKYK